MDHRSIDQKIEQLNQDLYNLGDELIQNVDTHKQLRLRQEEQATTSGGTHYADEITEAHRQQHDIFARRSCIMNEIRFLEDMRSRIYVRPTGGIVSVLNSLLPRQKVGVIAVHPLKSELAKIPSQHGAALLAVVLGGITYVTLSSMYPWTGVSVGALVRGVIMSAFGLDAISAAVLAYSPVAVIGLWHIRLIKNRTVWPAGEGISPLGGFVVRQEHHFRLGAEQWGIFTQIRASLVYGLRFIPFLLPLGGLAAMAVYGFVLMRVYIRAFRKNESVDEAILTSTKANAAACIWLPLVLGVIIAINFFVSLMQ